MDEIDQQLYQEEERQLLLNLQKKLETLIKIFSGKIAVEFDSPEQQKIKGEVTIANPVSSVTVANNQEITDALKGLNDNLTQAIKENKTVVPKKITVENIKDAIVDSVTIKNLKDLTAYFDRVVVAIKTNAPVIKVEKQEITWPTQAKSPIAVRLSDGKSFYNAVAQAFSGGVATAGLATDAKLDEVITALESLSVTTEPAKATDSYGIQAISEDATYKYFWFEDAAKNYYIMRKHLTNKVFTYTKGVGGYESVYQSAILGPSGSPTFDSYGDVF